VTPYRLIRHSYYSKDDGSHHSDLIRSNPWCYEQVRFDTVLVQVAHELRPARLHLVFTVETEKKVWQLARVTYFTAIRPAVAVDRAIGMCRYEEEQRGEFITLNCIVRSCYMCPIYASQGHFYLNDLIAGDVDLYLRIRDGINV
jgi:hypothetical protein